jgi:hypothetical protein
VRAVDLLGGESLTGALWVRGRSAAPTLVTPAAKHRTPSESPTPVGGSADDIIHRSRHRHNPLVSNHNERPLL